MEQSNHHTYILLYTEFNNYSIYAIREKHLFIGSINSNISCQKICNLFVCAKYQRLKGNLNACCWIYILPPLYYMYTLTWVQWSVLHNRISDTIALLYASIQKANVKRVLMLFACYNCFVPASSALLNACI